jgi:hypothetical protein
MAAINEMAGTVAAVPGLDLARLVSKANFNYQSEAPAAIELAVMRLVIRFGLSASRARTVAELAGMGGRA